MQASGGVILKVDKRARIRRSAGQREELLAEYGWSGLSGPQFAAMERKWNSVFKTCV